MRAIVTAMLSLAAVAAAGYLAANHGWLRGPPPPPPGEAIDDVPQLSLAVAASHRATRFEQILTIEDVLALPGDFSQAEALYALAGRSDSAAVQDLIFQASGIRNVSERRTVLTILFSRLTELDPPSSLALAASDFFASEPTIESAVWTSWSRLDLDAALRRAATLDTSERRKLAADALLAAHGYWGNEITDRIATVLGVDPDSDTRSQHLFALANRRPAEAIEYLNALGDTLQQQELAGLLGRHLGKLGIQAADYAALFDDEALRHEYRNSVVRAAAKIDPEKVLDTLLSDRSAGRRHSHLYYAITALADRDLDRAIVYLDRTTSRQDRGIVASVIASRLAREDPQRALTWVTENDRSPDGEVRRNVLMTIATEHPELALQEAESIANLMQKRQAHMMIAMTLAQQDPEKAIALTELVSGEQERRSMLEVITDRWVQQDPDAALSWLVNRDAADDDAMMRAAQSLAQVDLDSAMRWLPRVGERHQSMWRSTIAAHLAAQRSPAVAESFIARFQHSADYPQLVASVAAGVAPMDIEAAFRMGERIPSADEREALTVQLIGHEAHANPSRSAERLATIADPANRAAAAGQVAAAWAQQDSAAAESWARNLEPGSERDQAIAHLTWTWEDLTPARRELINSVGDPKLRQQGLTNLVYRIARTDIRRAESLLDELDLAEDDRRRVERDLDSMRNPARYLHY